MANTPRPASGYRDLSLATLGEDKGDGVNARWSERSAFFRVVEESQAIRAAQDFFSDPQGRLPARPRHLLLHAVQRSLSGANRGVGSLSGAWSRPRSLPGLKQARCDFSARTQCFACVD